VRHFNNFETAETGVSREQEANNEQTREQESFSLSPARRSEGHPLCALLLATEYSALFALKKKRNFRGGEGTIKRREAKKK